jgi:hypothetical protein
VCCDNRLTMYLLKIRTLKFVKTVIIFPTDVYHFCHLIVQRIQQDEVFFLSFQKVLFNLIFLFISELHFNRQKRTRKMSTINLK